MVVDQRDQGDLAGYGLAGRYVIEDAYRDQAVVELE